MIEDKLWLFSTMRKKDKSTDCVLKGVYTNWCQGGTKLFSRHHVVMSPALLLKVLPFIVFLFVRDFFFSSGGKILFDS